jgi:hypothetical protein
MNYLYFLINHHQYRKKTNSQILIESDPICMFQTSSIIYRDEMLDDLCWIVVRVYSSFFLFLSDGIYFRTIPDALAGVRLICIHLYIASLTIGFCSINDCSIIFG